MEELLGQFRFFLVSGIWGIILSVAYDLLRIFRHLIHHSNFLTGVEDLLFWIVSGCLVFRMIYLENNGEIRAFAFIGLLIGALCYFSVTKGLKKIINRVRMSVRNRRRRKDWSGRRR
ncbi:spore cortex biosynthesis protein YabQ [Anaerolentibacter hominis]|uniref:spore cortex biosynthesis protein YabQ n=1 Tax=Anaerolentibacter hominis TaxID=3079009 RepID=UPI0031B8685D